MQIAFALLYGKGLAPAAIVLAAAAATEQDDQDDQDPGNAVSAEQSVITHIVSPHIHGFST
jgi:hypothetical protein